MPPGTYVYGFSATIPPGALPSFKGSATTIRHAVRVRADIPGGIEAVHESEVRVVPLPVEEAQAISCKPAGGPGEGPQVRAELDASSVNPGGILTGRVTVTNPGGAHIRDVEVRLVEREWAEAKGRTRTSRRVLDRVGLPVARGPGGDVLPFAIRVPLDAAPSYQGTISSLAHLVEARADVAFARDIRAEVQVRIGGPPAT